MRVRKTCSCGRWQFISPDTPECDHGVTLVGVFTEEGGGWVEGPRQGVGSVVRPTAGLFCYVTAYCVECDEKLTVCEGEPVVTQMVAKEVE